MAENNAAVEFRDLRDLDRTGAMAEDDKARRDEDAWGDELARLVTQFWRDVEAEFPATTPEVLAMHFASSLGQAFREVGLPLEVVGRRIAAKGEYPEEALT